MDWRVAKSLLTLLDQVDAIYPHRDKSSDGTIGNLAHQQEHSDHNPNPAGVVCAMDITHDPASGCDSYKLAEHFRAAKDARVQYVISNRKIANADPIGDAAPWAWRPYTGANPHDHHVHVSVRQNAKLYDNETPWDLGAPIAPDGSTRQVSRPLLKRGSTGEDVKRVQYLVGVGDDGEFGPKTEDAVRAFQTAHGLVADGKVGAYTWRELDALSGPWVQPAAPEAQSPVPSPQTAPNQAPPAARGVLFTAKGRMSTFGGPKDTGMEPVEGLALYQGGEAQMVDHGLGDWLLPIKTAGVSGLGRRLDPNKSYIACRWDTKDYSFLRDAVVHVYNADSGQGAIARAVDWGPNVKTGRIADLSPGLARSLGLDTNDACIVTVYEDGK